MSPKPTKSQLQTFVEVFHALDRFEGTQRFIRGYGAALPEDKSMVEDVDAVKKWIRGWRTSTAPQQEVSDHDQRDPIWPQDD